MTCDLDFLALCISWIDDDKKRQAALNLCDNHNEKNPDYDPDNFRDLLNSKLQLSKEFDLVVVNSANKKFYCPTCHEIYDIPCYSEDGDVEFDCDCGEDVLSPLTEDKIYLERVSLAKEEYPTAHFINGFEKAFVGITFFDLSKDDSCAIYDYDKCVDVVIEDNVNFKENTAEGFVKNRFMKTPPIGKNYPLFLHKCDAF